MTAEDNSTIDEVLAQYDVRRNAVERAGHGLINDTWIVTGGDGQRAVLQRLHPAIDATANARINRLAERLSVHGLVSPRVIETSTGALDVPTESGVWRMLTWIDGQTCTTVENGHRAAEAGRMLGAFHAALREPEAMGVLPHSTTHSLSRHLDVLRDALREHAAHAHIDRIQTLSERIFAAADALEPVPPTPLRIVHGDPKISNFLFDRSGRAICLVDLDTIALMPLPFELGDAFRSWCNPAGEDTEATGFSLALFESAVGGYASVARSLISDAEIRGIVPATETIFVELAARFCADALRESYFGWDPARYPSRSEHNRVRATGQINAALALSQQRRTATQVVAGVFAPLHGE